MTIRKSDDLGKPVLVAGASGFLGSHVARLLVKQGRKVRVLLRKTSSKEAIKDLPVEIVYGDALDPESLRVAMQGCSSVFYCVVDPRYYLTDTTPLFRNNVEGLVNGLEAALANGVERFIFTSTMGALGQNPDGAVTEEIEFNWMDKAPPYIRSRKQAEDQFNKYCREKGLPGVALCISTTYGPEDYQPTPQGQMLWDTSQGRTKFVWKASQPIVDIRDAAEALLLAEQHGRIGERYIISHEYVSYRSFFAQIAVQGGHAAPIVLPLSVAYAAAWLGEGLLKLLRRKDYFVSSDAVFLSVAFGEMDSSKARRELHWMPRPVIETIRDSIAWFSERNKVAPIGAGSPSYFGRTGE